jgi:xanthine/uracil/vitamin C permease (AzgA family)
MRSFRRAERSVGAAEMTTEAPGHLQRRLDGARRGLDRWFEIPGRGTTYRTEVVGGLTTFLTLVYIVFVNPAVLSSTPDLNGVRLPFDQVLAVTALAGGVLTVMMGVLGRYPFALAAGLGLNAFAAAEVAAHRVSWSAMMGIFVIDGAVIVVLVVLGLRERIIGAIPFDLKLGGAMSASSSTTFIESNAGVTAGARTGLASIVTAVLLLLCLFISPIAGVIPTEATAQALVIVGVMMFGLVRDLRWDNSSPLAVFATIIVMPVTYSIANGVGVGILLHTGGEVLNGRRVSPVLVIFSGFFVWYFLHGTI